MFTQLNGWLTTFLNSYVNSVVGTLAAALAPIALILLTLYIANYGFAVMRGEVEEPFGVFAWKMVKMSFILAFSLGSALYLDVIVVAIQGMQDGMATVFVSSGLGAGGGASASSAFGALDMANEKASDAARDMWLAGGILNGRFDLIIAAIIYSLGVCAFLLVAAVVTLIAKMFMAFALAIGPAAILCLMFQPSAKYFDSWLSVALSAAVLSWFAFFGLGLALFVGDQLVTQINATGAFQGVGTTNPISVALNALVLYALLAILLWQAPSLASALTGGPAMRGGVGMAMSYAMGRSGGGGGSSAGGGGAAGGGGNRVAGGGGMSYGVGHAAGAAAGMAYQQVPKLFSGGRR